MQVFIWLVMSMMLTIAGPFGTYMSLSHSVRALYWLLIIGMAIAVSMTLKQALLRLRPDDHLLVRGAIMSVAMTLVFTPILITIAHVTGGLRASVAEVAPAMALNVFLVSCSIATAQWVHQLQSKSLPKLMKRLPEERRWGDVIRISSRDHYVEVITEHGTETLLMRFADAIGEMDGIEGMQVHRSHWVAKRGICRVEREKGRWYVCAKDGERVPVSRSYLDAVREAGLLPRAAA